MPDLDLSAVPTEQLQAELESRAAMIASAEAAASLPPARPLAEVDWSRVYRTITEGIETAARERFVDSDLEGYVMEEVERAVYGDEYFAWRRKQKW